MWLDLLFFLCVVCFCEQEAINWTSCFCSVECKRSMCDIFVYVNLILKSFSTKDSLFYIVKGQCYYSCLSRRSLHVSQPRHRSLISNRFKTEMTLLIVIVLYALLTSFRLLLDSSLWLIAVWGVENLCDRWTLPKLWKYYFPCGLHVAGDTYSDELCVVTTVRKHFEFDVCFHV